MFPRLEKGPDGDGVGVARHQSWCPGVIEERLAVIDRLKQTHRFMVFQVSITITDILIYPLIVISL